MQTNGYPCPGCGGPADLTAGCRACGRGPDPAAAEVVRLNAEIAVLTGQREQARRTYHELGVTLETLLRRRSELAGWVRANRTAPVVAPQVRAAQPTVAPTPSTPVNPVSAGPVPPGPAPVGPAQPGPVPVGPVPVGPAAVGGTAAGQRETSTRTVQGLLFVLGGLLLGTAAIVFTAVAWASVGVVGRATILAVVTALALAVPPIAVRRGLRGTAETFAAVGLLLVLLDGYAAWTVNLAGVTDWPGSRYAALVAAVVTGVCVGYARATRLAVPWFGALLAAQPVLPLLAAEHRPGFAATSLVYLGVALLNVAVVGALTGRRPVPEGTAVATGSGRPLVVAGQVIAWVAFAGALATATVCAVVTLVAGVAFGVTLLTGVPLLLVGAVLFAAGLVAGGAGLRTTAAALLVVAVAVAVLRPVHVLRPSVLLVVAAVVVLGLAAVVHALPSGVRTGPQVGGYVVTGLMTYVVLAPTGVLAVAAVVRSLPPWQGAPTVPDLHWGWQLPVAVLLTTGAALLLLPRAARHPVLLGGGVLTALAVPAVSPVPWPVVTAVGLVAGTVLLLVAVFRPGSRPYQPPLTAAAGLLLTGHALLVGLAEPVGAGVVLAGWLCTGLLVAGRARRLTGSARWLAGPALVGALLAVPALVVVVQAELDPALPWRLRGPAIAVGLLPVALLAVRRCWPDLQRYAAATLVGTLPLVALAPVVVPAGESVALYLAATVLVAVVGAIVVPDGGLRVVGAVLAALTGVALVPAVFLVLVAPYGWLAEIWSGAPDGVGLSPELAPARLSVAVALVVLLAAVLVAGQQTLLGRGRALPFAVPVGTVTVPVLLGALGTPWPVVPATSLLLGLTALLAATLLTTGLVRPDSPATSPAPGLPAAGPPPGSPAVSARRLLLPVLAATGLPLATAGLAGLLPTRATTLGGLGLALVAATVVGVAGRAEAVRPVAWLVAAFTGTGFAVTAALAAELPLRTAGSVVLAVAVLVLAAAALLAGRRPVEGLVLDAAAQAVALTAFLLAVGARRHAALLCVLWGAAVAVRALRPGESAGRRWTLAVVAGVSELVGAWLLLTVAEVSLLEAYTLPAAALALLAGLAAMRTRVGLTSWVALGPGLAAALLPSLVSVLVGADAQPWRRLLLGAGALAVVLVGAVRRWQAPVVLGAGTLLLLALHEVVRSWDLVPRWIFLALGGLVLIGLATTYERRRRDLARLRSAVGRMG